ncbi:MAG TPA: DUF1850 domain-containing protein [Paucimonas sp.]|nr:DUF1850 domain-containing protein [Paucimonas sp.]HJW57399.1 DUF1850 domain-containing protein [Burkholderiaceae bacterium]
MIALCIAAAGALITLPLQSFTLAWTHSIEKIRWEEDYRVEDQRLLLVEARIRGSGAGMDIPDDAVLVNGVWHYAPALKSVPRLRLARSPYVADYQLCYGARCHPMAEIAGPVESATLVELYPCHD